MTDQKRLQKLPFSALYREMAANRGSIDHVLPVVGQPQIDQKQIFDQYETTSADAYLMPIKSGTNKSILCSAVSHLKNGAPKRIKQVTFMLLI